MVAAVSVVSTDLSDGEAVSVLNRADPSGQFMYEHQAQTEALLAQGGVPVPKPVALPPVGRGFSRFRTKPGRRRTTIYLRLYIEDPNPEVNIKRKNIWERAQKQKFGDNWKKVLEMDRKVFAETDQTEFKFDSIGNEQEAQFVTSNPLIAEYIRMRLPDYPYIYEEILPFMVEHGGEMIEVMPTTIAGMQAAARAQAGA